MLRALPLCVAVWASLQQLQLTLCVHDSGNQKGAVTLNPAHSKGNCGNLVLVWDLYEFTGGKMTTYYLLPLGSVTLSSKLSSQSPATFLMLLCEGDALD